MSKRIAYNLADWRRTLEAMKSANPVNSRRVTWELSSRLAERAIIASYSGALRQMVCAGS